MDLIPEPENKEGQNAVKVVYQGKPLGYLPRSKNRPIADIFKARLKSYWAKIQSLYFETPLFEQLEISLIVKKD